MNIAVVGTGMVGRLIAVELSREHQVYAIDNNRSIKILQWKDELENTLNAHFGKTLIARDEENELMPMDIKRREFRYILKNHFSGVNMKN